MLWLSLLGEFVAAVCGGIAGVLAGCWLVDQVRALLRRP